MTKYVPRHMLTRGPRAETALLGAQVSRGGRAVVATGAAATLPVGAAAVVAAPAMASTQAEGTTVPATVRTFTFNSRGEGVKQLQGRLGVTADGWFGPVTMVAVKRFQQENGLFVSGVVDPQTQTILEHRAVMADEGTRGADDFQE